MFTLGDLVLNIFIFLFGLLWALIMVNAEGANGWGGKSPAWKIDSNKWYALPFKFFTWGREINLLPVFAIITFTVTFLLPPLWNYSKGLPFNIVNWGEIIAYFSIFAVHEDFLWFLINPHFGFKKFKKQFILWHPHWWLGLPKEYWIGFAVFTFAGLLSRGVIWWSTTLLIQLIVLLISILISIKIIKSPTTETS